VDTARGRFEIGRTHSTLDAAMLSKGVQGGPFDLRGEPVRLHVFLDRSMVEAYLNDRKSLTSRTFPSRLDATGLGLLAAPSDRVVALRVWRLGTLSGKPAVPAQPPGVAANANTACVSMCGHLNNSNVPVARRVE